jgi:hypothetical protein
MLVAVQAYTGSANVDIVAHSLGVTLARDVMRRYPALARDVVAFVGIAGGNEGDLEVPRAPGQLLRMQRGRARLTVAGLAQRSAGLSRDAGPDEVDDDLQRVGG